MLHQIEGLKDVAFEVLKYRHFPESERPHKLRVAWWNVVPSHLPFPMGLQQSFSLTDKQWCTRRRLVTTEAEDTGV